MVNLKSNDEFFEALIKIARVTKVVKGGRNFSFSALVVVGNKNGEIGYAHAKAKEANDAKSKAVRLARGRMVRVPIYQSRTIHHDTYGAMGCSKVMIRRAKPGTGIIAGKSMRPILELLGLNDVVAKVLGSANPYTVVMATFDALMNLNSPRAVASRRDKKVFELVSPQSNQYTGKEQYNRSDTSTEVSMEEI